MPKAATENFETELNNAAALLCADSHNSNSGTTRCDRAMCLPVIVQVETRIGVSVLMECKQTELESFRFSNISQNQRLNLEHHHQCSGISLVLIKSTCGPKNRYFGCDWPDWMDLEDAFGFDAAGFGGRRKPGTASFPLTPDEHRPGVLVELFKVRREHGLAPALNLAPLLPPGVTFKYLKKEA